MDAATGVASATKPNRSNCCIDSELGASPRLDVTLNFIVWALDGGVELDGVCDLGLESGWVGAQKSLEDGRERRVVARGSARYR